MTGSLRNPLGPPQLGRRAVAWSEQGTQTCGRLCRHSVSGCSQQLTGCWISHFWIKKSARMSSDGFRIHHMAGKSHNTQFFTVGHLMSCKPPDPGHGLRLPTVGDLQLSWSMCSCARRVVCKILRTCLAGENAAVVSLGMRVEKKTPSPGHLRGLMLSTMSHSKD